MTSPTSTLLMAEQATRIRMGQLQRILEWIEPEDASLRDLLEEMAADTRMRRDLIELKIRQTSFLRPRNLELKNVRSSFPSLSHDLGEGPLSRDIALYLIELLEEESATFYQELAQQAADETTLHFFLEISGGELKHLDYLRTALF